MLKDMSIYVSGGVRQEWHLQYHSRQGTNG